MSGTIGTGSPDWWRTVLGEYSTGVVLVTTTDEFGEAAAMIAGTFTAVSQDPPMVGFLPSVSSKTLGKLRTNGTFSISVLGARHEGLSRAFGGYAENRFELAEWNTSEDGNLRVTDALAWFDCTLTAVHEAGDHLVVLADVVDYGVGDGAGGLPLLFLRGGYGTFAAPAERFDTTDLSIKLRMVGRLREIVTGLAEEHGVRVLLGALAGESVVVLEEATGDGEDEQAHREYGVSFPFAAPMGAALAAWAPDARVTQWLEGARHLIGTVDRVGFSRLLEGVRERGYAISAGQTMLERFDPVVADGPGDRAALVQLWRDIHEEQEWGDAEDGLSSVQVPIFDDQGHAVMELVLSGLGRFDDSELERVLGSAVEAARAATALIGGRCTSL